MKKKEILYELKYIINRHDYPTLPIDIQRHIEKLIQNIKKDMKPEREYFSSKEAINKLIEFKANKITHHKDKYCAFHNGCLAWFTNSDNFINHEVDILDNSVRWWVVE